MTCKDCIHRDVCYKRESVPDENYAEKCGDFIYDKVLEERPQGEWIERSDETHYCSNCRGDAIDGDFDEILTTFCPNCGARMEFKKDQKES